MGRKSENYSPDRYTIPGFFSCTFSRRFKVTVPQKAEFWEVLPEFLPVLAEFLKILFTEGPTEDSKT